MKAMTTQPVIPPVASGRRIPRKEDVWHLIKMGVLTGIKYDCETIDLHPSFSWPIEFGGVVRDVAGNVLAAEEIVSRTPEHLTISPEAALVTRRTVDNLYTRGDIPHIAAGKIFWFFKNASDLSQKSPIGRALTEGLSPSVIHDSRGSTIEGFLYPLEAADGTIDHVLIHKDGKYLSYKNERDDWVRVPIAATSAGYNRAKADDRWLWSMLFMTGHDDVFVTHVKKYGKLPIDLFQSAHIFSQFGPLGENGFRPGERKDPRNGRWVNSFKLGDLALANTRRAVPERGIEAGLLLPDGSEYDPLVAHGTLPDVWTTEGLGDYMRRIDPDLMRHIEQMSDLPYVKKFLMGSGERPLIGIARSMGTEVTNFVGMCANVDEMFGDFKQAVLINLTDFDPSTHRVGGRLITEWSIDQLEDQLRKDARSPRPFLLVEHLRRTPRIVSFERGYNADIAARITPDDLERRAQFFRQNPGLLDRIMQAYERTLPTHKPADLIPNPQPEEELFTFMGDLKRVEMIIDGQSMRVHEAIHQKASDRLNNARRITYWLKRALKPDPMEWHGPDTPPDVQAQYILGFIRKIRECQKKLDYYGGDSSIVFPDLPVPTDQELKAQKSSLELYVRQALVHDDLREALIEYLWDLRARNLGDAIDYTMKYDVIDQNGQRIPWDQVMRIDPIELKARLERGELDVEFERLDTTAWISTFLFMNADRGEELGEDSMHFYKAVCSLRTHGEPDRDASQHRWMSVPRALKRLDDIEHNIRRYGQGPARDEDLGWWDVFVARPHHEQQEILYKLRAHYTNRLHEHPLDDQALRTMGYDPRTQQPLPNIDYPVDPASVQIIDIPDHHLEAPLSHKRIAAQFFMIPRQPVDATKALILRAQHSRKLFLAARHRVIETPSLSGTFNDIYRAARNAYQDSGLAVPASFVTIAFERRVPIHGLATPDCDHPTLKTGSLHEFAAILSPHLGLRSDQQTGLVLRDYGFAPQVGPTRLLEADDGGRETGWEIPIHVRTVQKMTLADVTAIDDAAALRYGFASCAELSKTVHGWFADRNMSPAGRHDQLSFWVVDLDPVVADQVLYYAPWEIPVAAVDPVAIPEEPMPEPPPRPRDHLTPSSQG